MVDRARGVKCPFFFHSNVFDCLKQRTSRSFATFVAMFGPLSSACSRMFDMLCPLIIESRTTELARLALVTRECGASKG